MDGLSEILKQKYDPDHQSEEKKNIKIMETTLKAQALLKKKEKGKKVSLADLG